MKQSILCGPRARFLGLLALLVLLSAGCGEKQETPEEIPEIMRSSATVLKNQHIDSKVLGMPIQYSIWLPPTYSDEKRYPILYLLHGYEFANAQDAHNGWFNNANLNHYATQSVRDGGPLFIIVTPNGQNAFYRNGFVAGMDYDSFFEDEFIPFIEDKYNGNGKRAVAGLSMGGYGSLYHGMAYPGRFTYIYACSPATSAGYVYPDLSQIVAASDPATLPPITIETGIDDSTVSLSSVQSFCRTLDERKVGYDFISRSGGHDWTFWTNCLPKILKAVGNSFK